jgi:hypothetical protein
MPHIRTLGRPVRIHPINRCLGVVMLLCAISGCAGSSSATSGQTPSRAASTKTAPTVGGALLPGQFSLVGHVRGSVGGYTSLIVVTDAERSLKPSQAATLVVIAGVGRLRVTCSAHPAARFIQTPFAAGEGPPNITHDTEQTHARPSLVGFTRQYPLSVQAAEATDQTLQHWEIDGGGEAFQFAVHVTDLLTPTLHRCDMLATATTVTHGPFYRYAHARPGES